ncbi:MAG: hypothetical protein K6E75_03190 [Lachnospiraceae bacterium]|nr:hypothetical protein [Lachnospiraceae bacterium]
MELFMDRYGGIITLVLAGILTLLATLFFLNDSKMSKRIAYLEGCCEQVQERLESTSVADEETIRAAVESEMEAFRTQQAEMVSKEIEAEREALKEEIRAEIETEVMESVKVQMEENRKSTSKTTGKSNSAKTNTSQSVTTNTTAVETQITAQASRQSSSEPADDPDDKHFVVGSGDEEED